MRGVQSLPVLFPHDSSWVYQGHMHHVPQNARLHTHIGDDLHKVFVENKLIDPGEKMSRQHMKQKMNVNNDGKLKKRRYYKRKNMRRMNMHLDGTEIGAMLTKVEERQSQGKLVGGGGM